MCAYTCNDNRNQQQKNCEHRETCQTLPRRSIVLQSCSVGGVHTDELEEEVGERDEVHDNNDNHSRNGFAADPESRKEKEHKCYDQSGGSETEFDSGCVFDDNEELYREGKEEEEVELEKGDVNLGRVSIVLFVYQKMSRGVPGM